MADERERLDLRCRVGEQAVIELPALPGAGVIWIAPDAPDGCSIERLDNADRDSAIGGETVQRFAVRCERTGDWSLRFLMKRPWEETIRALQTVEVKAR